MAATKLRTIETPADDFLTATQVAVYLGYKDAKSARELVEAGEFPEPLLIRGQQVWEWESVYWYQLNVRFGTRLRRAETGGTPDEEPPIPPRGRKTN